MTKHCLVAIQGPTALISGLSAMLSEAKRNNHKLEAVLLLYGFNVEKKIEKQLCDIILKMSPVFKWKKVVFINGADMNILSFKSREIAFSILKNKLGKNDFDHIYLSRNYYDFGSSLIMNCYINSKKISYGDGFGLTGQNTKEAKEVQDKINIKQLFKRLKNAFSEIFKNSFSNFFLKLIFLLKIKSKQVYETIPFDSAVMILPMDFSGEISNDKIKLEVTDFDVLKKLISDLNNEFPELNNYCNNLISKKKEKYYLYLLITPTESGNSTLKNEIAMYVDAIEENSPVGSTVLIKLHPRKSVDFGKYLLDLLKNKYNIKIITVDKYKSLPIEIWKPLIHNCEIISFSSSTLSLRYLYNKKIKWGFTEKRIKKYLKNKSKNIFINELDMWNQAEKNLDDWDKNNFLWSNKTLK